MNATIQNIARRAKLVDFTFENPADEFGLPVLIDELFVYFQGDLIGTVSELLPETLRIKAAREMLARNIVDGWITV